MLRVLVATLLLEALLLPVCRSQLTWTIVPQGTAPRPSVRNDFGFGYDPTGNSVYVFGGQGGSGIMNDLWRFDLSTNSWTEVNPTTSARPPVRFSMISGFYTQGPDGLFVISTGEGSGKVFYNDIWAYNVRTGVWTELSSQGDVPTERYGAAGGLHVNGTALYVTHGFSNRRFSDTVRYDFSESRWITEFGGTHEYSATQPHPRCLLGSTMAGPDEPVFFGGCLSGGFSGGPCPAADSWAFRNSKWERMDDCAAPRQYSAIARWPGRNGEVVMFGGLENDRSIIMSKKSETNEVDYLQTSTGTWRRLVTVGAGDGTVPALRSSHGMVTITNGNPNGILLWGGSPTNVNGDNVQDMWLLTGNPDMAGTAGSCGPTWFLYMHLHGFFMIISWGILLIAGVFIARYCRDQDPLWFKLHRGIQIIGTGMSILGIILVLPGTRAAPNFAHSVIGVLILIFSIQQIINGFMRPPKDKEALYWQPKKRAYWELWHKWGARLFLVLGAINISLGVFLIIAPTSIIAVWFTILGLWVLAFAAAEFFHQLFKSMC
eukprot:scpid59324/ scgid28898/ Nitrile-specifier protein 2